MNIQPESTSRLVCDRLASGCDTMKALLLRLLDGNGRVAEEVHGLRKLGKSLRGGFSLFRLEKSAVLEIQAVGRILSGPRDAVSRLNTWNKLGWVGDAGTSSAIVGLLEKQTHSAARRPPPDTIAWCVTRVEAARNELNKLPEEDLDKRIAQGLEKLQQKALKRCRKLDHRAGEDFHEARKALKAWLGAVGFLPEDMVPLDQALLDLASLLGDENDLTTLSDWLAKHGFTARFAPDLWKTLGTARREIQRKVIKDAARLSPTELS